MAAYILLLCPIWTKSRGRPRQHPGPSWRPCAPKRHCLDSGRVGFATAPGVSTSCSKAAGRPKRCD